MSTRVLTRKAAAAVQPIQWPSVHAMEQSVEAGGEVERGAELEHQLRQRDARIAALERELAQVNQESQQRIQEAAEAARKEGESAARRTADNELQTEIAKIRRMMNDVVLSGTMLRRQAEEDMVRLSIAIARRILHREISLDPEAFWAWSRQRFQKSSNARSTRFAFTPIQCRFFSGCWNTETYRNGSRSPRTSAPIADAS